MYIPTVSIIIAVYNGADTIATCIESMLKLNYPQDKYDIIVVENGSTDDTSEIIKRYPVTLINSPFKGKQAALNLGIKQSSADIIAMTDADCIADPDWLNYLVQPYADEEVGGVGGEILSYTHPDLNIIERFCGEQNPLQNYITGSYEYLPHLYGANCSYRRELLHAINFYDTRLIVSDDVDICWRMQLQTGKKVAYEPRAVIHHHHRSTHSGLARQYYHYGFGEIVLDALYSVHPDYPRTLGRQLWHIRGQLMALGRYCVSMLLREVRYRRGQADEYHRQHPRLMFLVESSCIKGKIDAMLSSRFMTKPHNLLRKHSTDDSLVDRFYQTQKM